MREALASIKKSRIHSLSKILDNQIYYFNSEQEMMTNFAEYLKFKKYEVIEELSIFEKTQETNHNENKRIPIENFLDDEEFKEFLSQINQKQISGSLSPDLTFEELRKKGAGESKSFSEAIERSKSKILNLHEIELTALNQQENMLCEEKKQVFDIHKAINIEIVNKSYNFDENVEETNSPAVAKKSISKIRVRPMTMSQFVRNVVRDNSDNDDSKESSEGDSNSEEEEIEDIYPNESSSSDQEI